MIAVTLKQIDFLKRFRVLAYALVLIAITGFALAEGNPGLWLFAMVGCGVSWFLVEKRGRQLPRAMINLGVLMASLLLFYELVVARQENLLLSLGHFMVAILICKLFEPKGSRDYAQILILSLLIVVASAIFSQQSIMFGLLLAAYLVMGLYGILLFHLRHETHAAVERNATPDVAPMQHEQVQIRQHVRRVSKVALVSLFGVAAIVFLVFPRGRANDLLVGWAMHGQQRTGFSDSVRLMDFTRLQQSDAVAMEVKLLQGELNIGSEFYQPYFRGVVLDTYDPERRRWQRSPMPARARVAELMQGRATFALENISETTPSITQEYTLYSNTSGALLSMNGPSAVESQQLYKVTFYPETQTLDYPTRSFAPPLRYRLHSTLTVRQDNDQTQMHVPAGMLKLPVFERGEEPDAGPIAPEIVALARRIAGELAPADLSQMKPDDVRRLADRFEQYLRSNYVYSLVSRPVDGMLDPTADFLVNRQKVGGHCEYFASAMIMLCQSMGINARMVTGFRGGDFNTLGGYYTVRERHAHAWVEVYIPPRGWTLFDPTPAAVTEEPSSLTEWTRWLREMTDVVQKNWLAGVVTFDNSSRQYLAELFSGRMEAVGNWFSETMAEANDTVREMFLGRTVSFWQRFGVTAALGFTVVLAAWLLKRIYRRRHSRVSQILRSLDRKAQRELSEQLLFFDDVLALLARGRRKKADHETPLEYVESLRPVLGTSAEDARWLIQTFYDLRFGSTHITPTLAKQINSTFVHLKTTLTAKPATP